MKTLKEIADRITVLANMDDLSDEQVKELDSLNLQAAKMRAQEEGKKQIDAAKAIADEQARQERDAAIAEAVKAEAAKWEAAGRRLPDGQAPYQTQFSETNRYDHLNLAELALLVDLQKNFQAKAVKYNNGAVVSPTVGAFKALSMRVAELKNESNTDEERKAIDYVRQAFKMGTKTNIEPTPEAVSAAIKAATDPMYTGGSGIGSDWVGTAYSPTLWKKIRADTNVVGKIPSEVIPDGYSNETWPVEGADVTWYKVPEVTAADGTMKIPAATVTASQIATANKNITIGKLGARGMFSGEMTEDSLVRFAPQLQGQMEVSGREMLESLVIDGDVETSANKNINTVDGTPNATDYFLTFDGFRKLPLITNTANSLSAGGSLNIDDFLALLKLMGTAGIAGADPSKVNFILDGNVYYKMATLPEVKTKDVNSAATVENGFVTRVWNVGVIASWQMHKASSSLLANTAGKVATGTPGNNTTGAVLAVRWDQWKLAYKRRMTMEVTRRPESDSWDIVALTRLGLGYRDNEASAILYNVGV